MSLTPKYQCGICESIYETDDEAVDCWRDCVSSEDAEVSVVYVCPICSLDHDDEDEAIECCGYSEDAPVIPSAKELEDAGQMRLLP